jgi:hypothetical protein
MLNDPLPEPPVFAPSELPTPPTGPVALHRHTTVVLTGVATILNAVPRTPTAAVGVQPRSMVEFRANVVLFGLRN